MRCQTTFLFFLNVEKHANTLLAAQCAPTQVVFIAAAVADDYRRSLVDAEIADVDATTIVVVVA